MPKKLYLIYDIEIIILDYGWVIKRSLTYVMIKFKSILLISFQHFYLIDLTAYHLAKINVTATRE